MTREARQAKEERPLPGVPLPLHMRTARPGRKPMKLTNSATFASGAPANNAESLQIFPDEGVKP